MAGQVPRDKVYGNFRQRGALKPHRNSERYKTRPGMSEEHLALIRQLPCCACGSRKAVQSHHLKATGTNERGMGLRSTDKWALPLCAVPCHEEIERIGSRKEIGWFRERGIDALVLALDLWGSTGDLEKMKKIVEAHRASKTEGR